MILPATATSCGPRGALHRYRAGERWWLDNKLLTDAAEAEQAERYHPDPWQERIEAWITNQKTVSVPEILQHCLHIEVERWQQADYNRVARCLRWARWERFRDREGAIRQWRYRPGPTLRAGVLVMS
jgi:predicted P-loop ATPase